MSVAAVENQVGFLNEKKKMRLTYAVRKYKACLENAATFGLKILGK